MRLPIIAIAAAALLLTLFSPAGLEYSRYIHTDGPFASLLAKSPNVGLDLIRRLTNHATTGWR